MRKLGLVLLILLLYLPFISNNFNSVDDLKAVNSLLNTSHIDYFHLFFPKYNLHYYRPLTCLSFLFDQKIHFCSAYFMHFENIIIHLLNTILVMIIAKQLFASAPYWIIYLIGLIFAVHPINTEAVNWISARTDLMAGFFSFLAFILLMKNKNNLGIILSAFAFLAGLLCKESAIGFLFFAFLFVFFFYKENFSFKQKILFVFIFMLAFITYLSMRYPELRLWNLKKVHVISIEKIIPKGKERSELYLTYETGIFFKVIGFYFKKLFIPWPLNFAIITINKKFYLVFGITILLLIIFSFIKEKNGISLALAWSLCFMLIAVLVPLRKLAWTPLSERYVYISSLGMSLFIGYTILKLKTYNRLNLKYICYGICLYIFIFCVSTVYRNYIWNDNYRLYLDTVKKSPYFGPAHNELAIALLQRGKKKDAIKEFEIAARLTKGFPISYLAKSNILLLKQEKASPQEILNSYDELIKKTKGEEVQCIVLRNAIKYINYLILNHYTNKDKEKTKELYQKEIIYLKKLSLLENTAFCNYRIGQLYLALGDKSRAVIYFKKAYYLANKNAFFRQAAYKLIKNITKNQINK